MKKVLFFCLLILSCSPLIGQYATNGSATQLNESCIRVTQATPTQIGSAFFTTPLDLSQPFSFSGTMFFGVDDAGADGMTFLLATDTLALGASGGGIGYEGLIPSLIVEFDTWQNTDINDPIQDHIGIMSNGIADHNDPATLAPFITLPNIENGEEHCFTIIWTPSIPLFEATLSGITISYNGDISALFPPGVPVYYGYTGSTGGAVNEQRVCLYNTAELEQIAITEIPPICVSDGIQTLSANLEGGDWGGAANGFGQVNPTTLGTGFHTVTYGLGNLECEYSAELLIEVLPSVQASLVSQVNIDCVVETGSLEILAENGVEPYTYEWSTGETSPSIQNLIEGVYTLTVTDDNGCQAVETYSIVSNAGPQIENVEIVSPICDENNEIQNGSITINATGENAPFSYSIDGGTTFQEGNSFDNITVANGTITVLDSEDCSSSQEFQINLASYPVVDIQANSLEFCGENVVLTVATQDTETILWSTNETTETITLATAGLVSAEVSNASNCTTTAEVTVTECLDYHIPNVFTPNNDQMNDSFGLVTESENITFFLRIYSRWGGLVYEGDQNWDGTVDGKPFPADVLGYVMEVNIRGTVVVESGDVTLVR